MAIDLALTKSATAYKQEWTNLTSYEFTRSCQYMSLWLTVRF